MEIFHRLSILRTLGVMLTLMTCSAQAELKLPAIFTDHAILQRDLPIPVWGTAVPGEKVIVQFCGQEKTATADDSGRWMVKLDLMKAGGPFELTANAASGTVKIQDLLVGEVWLVSGQSNAQFPLKNATNGKEAVAAADHPQIRLLNVPAATSRQPQGDFKSQWSICTPKTAGGCSAIGYYMALVLHKELKVPIGIITSAYGGTVAEAWMRAEAMKGDPQLEPILATWEQFVRDYPADPAKRKEIAEHNKQKEIAAGRVPPPWTLEPKAPDHFHRPAATFNAMINPLISYAVRGVAWYQGEANSWRAQQYRKLLPALIADWRKLWNHPDLAFLLVQLPGFDADWMAKDTWPEMRESQAWIARNVKNSALVVTIDLGDPNDIHPKRKAEVGDRLARVALAKVYGKDTVSTGPVYRSMKKDSSKIRLAFDLPAGRLISKDGPLSGFTIAGADRRFVPARAEIEGKEVVVSAEEVTDPVAVRYGWANVPQINLFNEDGWPALPFRTDNWPGVTDGRVEPEAY